MNKLLEKWKGLSAGVRASLVYLVVNVLHMGIGFLTSPIYTRLLSEEDYGSVSVYNSYFSVVGVIAMYCLNYGFFDNAMHRHKEDRDILSYSVLTLSNIISVIVCIILFSVKMIAPNLITLDYTLLFILSTTFLLQPAYNLWVSRQRYEYKYRVSGIISITVFICAPIVAIICIKNSVFSSHVLDRVLGGYIPFYIVYIGMYLYTAKKAKLKINKKYWKMALAFNTPLIPHYLSLYILNSSDKIMIEQLIGKSEVAYYAVAATIASVASIVWTSINSSLVPFTYSKCDKEDYNAINKVTLPLIIFNVCVCVCVMLFAPEVLVILAPKSYSGALQCIPPLIAGAFFTSLYHLFANIIYYHSKTSYVMAASVTSAVVNIILNIILIPMIGYTAAAYTTLISYALQAAIDYFGMKKCAGRSIYNKVFLLSASLFMIAIALVMPLIYNYTVLRFSLVGVLAVSAIVFRKKIISLIMLIRKK